MRYLIRKFWGKEEEESLASISEDLNPAARATVANRLKLRWDPNPRSLVLDAVAFLHLNDETNLFTNQKTVVDLCTKAAIQVDEPPQLQKLLSFRCSDA